MRSSVPVSCFTPAAIHASVVLDRLMASATQIFDDLECRLRRTVPLIKSPAAAAFVDRNETAELTPLKVPAVLKFTFVAVYPVVSTPPESPICTKIWSVPDMETEE